MYTQRLRIILGMLPLFFSACTDADFESVTEVSKARIVDIIESPVGAAPNETMAITPVVLTPRELTESLHLSYQVCIFDQGPKNYYRCVEELPIPFPNILAEGEGDNFTFSQSLLSNQNLHDVCAILAGESDEIDIPPAVLASLPQCSVGLPVQIRVKMCVGAPTCEDAEAVIIRKQTHLLFEESASRSDRNVNPRIDGIFADDVELHEGSPHVVTLTEKEQEVKLRLAIDVEEAAQFFTPPFADASGAPVREELETRWFATTKGFSSSRRYYREGITREDELHENKITFDTTRLNDGDIVDLWVILRDSRLGSDVIHREFLIEKQ